VYVTYIIMESIGTVERIKRRYQFGDLVLDERIS
jgi:hypothetical protein